MTNAAAVKTQRQPQTRTRFYQIMSLVTIGIVIAAFAPSIVNPASRVAPLTLLVTTHAIVFFAWLLLFLVQTTLVTTGRIALHRRLGITAIGLAAIMIPVGYASAIAMARRRIDLSGDLNIQADPLLPLVFQLGDLLSFATLVTAALLYRRRAEIHKRLMLMCIVGTLMAALPLAHFTGHNLRSTPTAFVPLFAIVLFTPAIYDRIQSGRFHPVSLWGGVRSLSFSWEIYGPWSSDPARCGTSLPGG